MRKAPQLAIRPAQTVEHTLRAKNLNFFSPKPEQILGNGVEGNYGNFGNANSFHSFVALMEEKDIKDRILKGAEELILKYSIRSVSMDDIARHLSISKKTIYQYFADKDEIVTTVAAYHMEKNRVQFDSFRASAKDAIDELVRISICLRIDFQKMNPALLFDLQKYHSRAWNVWLEHKQNHVRESIIANLKQGIAEGFYRPEINTEILANTRLELIQLAFDDRIFNPSKFSLTEVHLQLFEHFIYGLLTDKGRKTYEKYKKEPINQELIPNYA